MKNFALYLFSFVSVMNFASATVDGHARVYLLVQDIQSEEFFVERAPIIGCYGLPQGPQLIQLTSEYKVSSNIGCGGPSFLDNINYLTCATVLEAVESDDFMSFSKITLDISKCEAKENTDFILAVKKVVKLNFPVINGEVSLTLIK
jgi:hypothetical protein